MKFKYEDELYSVTIKIVDKEKPIIKADQKIFVFDMKTSVKEVNKEINKHIKISDNYDKVFNDINVIDKVPSDE